MNLFGIAAAIFANSVAGPQPFPVRFVQGTMGREVTISINGGRAEREYAGKMGFQDENRSWQSVCADVRSPVGAGQFYQVRALSSEKFGGNVAAAGHIVAQWFDSATTPDQCAGLQIAVWKALEDGPNYADFTSGALRVRADGPVMIFAAKYYQSAAQGSGSAAFLQAQGAQGAAGGGQGQSSASGGGQGQSQLSTGGGSSS